MVEGLPRWFHAPQPGPRPSGSALRSREVSKKGAAQQAFDEAEQELRDAQRNMDNALKVRTSCLALGTTGVHYMVD